MGVGRAASANFILFESETYSEGDGEVMVVVPAVQ